MYLTNGRIVALGMLAIASVPSVFSGAKLYALNRKYKKLLPRRDTPRVLEQRVKLQDGIRDTQKFFNRAIVFSLALIVLTAGGVYFLLR